MGETADFVVQRGLILKDSKTAIFRQI